ncbi:hypothetical protein [Alicyclobacillus shizuokensis]|uniref:hypothetical protein n=1 Tax=Alicyclobacillus shizuokensis TaxID=392014 RepID=UPI00082A5A52|nr:hypothetical protein [Alicyclobacillus shizuokensis]
MASYLDQFMLTMPATQRQKLLELLQLKQQLGYIKSEYELQLELDNLLKQLDARDGKPTFQARTQSGITNSTAYNQNFEEIAFDLNVLFGASDTIDRLLRDNQLLSRAALSDIRKQIFAMQSKLEQLKLTMKNTDGFVQGVHEQFNVPQYTETDEQTLSLLRQDRFGQPVPAIYNAQVVGGALQLASSESFDALRTAYGSNIATIKVRNRVGPVATDNSHPVEYAIDGSTESYWAEAVLVDAPIQQDISNLWSHDYHDYPKDGALCELEIDLGGITTVSEITFDPYCAYPLEVVAIHGYESTDYDGQMYELISPTHPNPYQRSQSSTTEMTFQFPSVDISKIRILLRQENYVKVNYIVSQDQVNDMQLWNQIAQSDASTTIPDKAAPGQTVAEFDQVNQITGWNTYLNALEQWASQQGDKASNLIQSARTAMNVIRTGNYQNPMALTLRAVDPNATLPSDPELQKSWVPVSKLEYLYGAYDISINGRQYESMSVYVSKPLPLPGNIKNISIDTQEKHYDIPMDQGDQARITDIEYYITYKKNPDVEAWKPILPISKEYVVGELLLGRSSDVDYPELSGTMWFTLRFPAISADTVAVRRNGSPMDSMTYVLSDDGKALGIYPQYYSASSIYTVDYKPADSAYVVSLDASSGVEPVQFINDNGDTGEFFETVDGDNTVTLKHEPFIYRSDLFTYDQDAALYTQDDSKLSPANPYYSVRVMVNGVEYENITDYTTGTFDREKLQTANGGKCFAQIGNKIYFPTGQQLTNIVVDYFYLTTDIRLKAILRRNAAGYESVTPALYEYSVRCQTYDQAVKDLLT